MVPDGKINIFVVHSPRFDLSPVVTALNERGWMFVTNPEPGPVAICLCTMPQNEGSVEPFLGDLREAMASAAPAAAGAEGEGAGAGEATTYENM